MPLIKVFKYMKQKLLEPLKLTDWGGRFQLAYIIVQHF